MAENFEKRVEEKMKQDGVSYNTESLENLQNILMEKLGENEYYNYTKSEEYGINSLTAYIGEPWAYHYEFREHYNNKNILSSRHFEFWACADDETGKRTIRNPYPKSLMLPDSIRLGDSYEKVCEELHITETTELMKIYEKIDEVLDGNIIRVNDKVIDICTEDNTHSYEFWFEDGWLCGVIFDYNEGENK